MSYRRGGQRSDPKELSYARRFTHEALKENLGKLVEYGGMGIGTLAGFLASKTGLPLAPTAITLIGAAIGGLAGSTGKASIVSALDHFKERREKRRANEQGGDSAAPTATPSAHPIYRVDAKTISDQPSHRDTGGRVSQAGVGEIIVAVGEAITRFERVQGDLVRTVEQMTSSQQRLAMLLQGGRNIGSKIQALTAAREHVRDAARLVEQAGADLRTYLRSV